MPSQSSPNLPPSSGDSPGAEPRRPEEKRAAQVMSISSMLPPTVGLEAARQSPDRNNPTPLDVIFILFASVVLVVLVLSLSPVRGAQPFQNLPDWFVAAVSNVWNRLFLGAGALGSLGLRKWLDRSPAPNYLLWISALTVGLLAATLFSVAIVIPPPAAVVTGGISEPKPGQIVTRRTFVCKGNANGVGPQTHLWLAIEVNNQIWPKEREVHVSADGTWENTVYEDGATDKFSISLLSASPDAEKRINQWIEDGRTTGQYKQLSGIPGTERIYRVDGLRLKPN